MPVDFEDFSYYPNLRTRPAELFGYSKLSEEIKKNLLPVFTLGAWPKQDGLQESISQVNNAVEHGSYILDLTKESSHQNKEILRLLNADENFKEWRTFIEDKPNAIPVIQISEGAKTSQVIRQARLFERRGKVAFKISDFVNDTEKVTNALSALDSSSNALVIIDAGYIRETMAASIVACITAINEIRSDVDDAIISVVSTSFPSTVTPFLDPNSKGQRGVINNLERVLHQEIGLDAAIYGDHGSIHAKVYSVGGGKYIPRIDYPLDDAWVFERRVDANSMGYVENAKALIQNYPEILKDTTWGARAIINAQQGLIDGMKTPSSWIAARVNMHISRQFELSKSGVAIVDEAEEFDDLV